ncbi:MAG TPA: NRDE family protein [Usitatibacter sp.]|nr:NRDE family protein [Usitatibacter sp.]
MCLILIAWRVRADLPLVVAANRDEWRERPTEPAHWWSEHPDLLAGRDLRAGGTWMGVTRGGRFAAVTNFRDPTEKRSAARSRGTLVTDYLTGRAAPGDYLAGLAAHAGEYNAFNLIVGDGQSLWGYGSRDGPPREIEPGIHGLSNHVLDEPWPKVVRGRAAMREALEHRDPVPPLFDFLSDARPAPDPELPGTGVSVDWERRLSSALIIGADYGTRASTVVAMSASGALRFEERTRGPGGEVTAAVVDGEPTRMAANQTPA